MTRDTTSMKKYRYVRIALLPVAFYLVFVVYYGLTLGGDRLPEMFTRQIPGTVLLAIFAILMIGIPWLRHRKN